MEVMGRRDASEWRRIQRVHGQLGVRVSNTRLMGYQGISNSELFAHFERQERVCEQRAASYKNQARTIMRRKKTPDWEDKLRGVIHAAWFYTREAEKWRRETLTFRQICTPTTAPLPDYIPPREGVCSVHAMSTWPFRSNKPYTVPGGRKRR